MSHEGNEVHRKKEVWRYSMFELNHVTSRYRETKSL